MSNTPKFRLRLNLFDGIILVLALVAAAVMFYLAQPHQVSPSKSNTTTVTYTLQLQECVPQLEGAISPEDVIEDAVKNLGLGTVVSTSVRPNYIPVLDEENLVYRLQPNGNLIDVNITVTASATISDEFVTLSSGYVIRGGDEIFVRGPGYLGSGIVLEVNEEGVA